MYRLYDLGNKWELHTSKHGAFSGSFEAIMGVMLFKLEFNVEDLEEGITMICRNGEGHNGVEFGIFKSPIFTCKKEEGKKAG